MPTIQEQFFDIGANLTHESFEADLDDVISVSYTHLTLPTTR